MALRGAANAYAHRARRPCLPIAQAIGRKIVRVERFVPISPLIRVRLE